MISSSSPDQPERQPTGKAMQAYRHRWRRFCRDLGRTLNWCAWIPGLLGPTLISAILLQSWALQAENTKNQLLARLAQERINKATKDLIAEAKDYAIWDDTYNFLAGTHPAYLRKNFNAYSFARMPVIAFLDQQGHYYKGYYFNQHQQTIEDLPASLKQDLIGILPSLKASPSKGVLATLAGKPYLLSLQDVLPTSGKGTRNGMVVMTRGVDTFQSLTMNKALGILDESFHAPRPLRQSWLGPMEMDIPHPQLMGRRPLQHLVTRKPDERINWALALVMLLGFDLLLLGMSLGQTYLSRRRHRHQDLLLLREQKKLSRNLQRRERTDLLTGLLSEAGLLQGIQDQHAIYPGFQQLVIHINIDHFAFLTSNMSRTSSDSVLSALASQLRKLLHPSAQIARLGADDFAGSIIGTSEASLLSELSDLSQAINRLEIPVAGHTPVRISASLGASHINHSDPARALHEASVACRIAKIDGGGGHQVYGESQSSTLSYLAIQRSNQELLSAIQDNRICLYAQHAWSLRQGDQLPSVYVELLARIEDASDGRRYWDERLIEAASFCGSLKQLDEHIFDLALPAIREVLKASAVGSQELVYAINISADILLSNNFISRLAKKIVHNNINPRQICLEITEKAALRNPSQAICAMQKLRMLGVKLALDDFGTGTTSLGYLRDLPLDYVKIDKTYIWQLGSDVSSELIIQFISDLGKEIGFTTIAEGVEDWPLLHKLQSIGIAVAQGYLVTRPQPFSADPGQWIFADAGQNRRDDGQQRS